MLLGDSWSGFPLTMALLDIARAKEDEGVMDFVVEYYICADKIDLLLQSTFADEIERSLSSEQSCFKLDLPLLLCFLCKVALYFGRPPWPPNYSRSISIEPPMSISIC